MNLGVYPRRQVSLVRRPREIQRGTFSVKIVQVICMLLQTH